MLEDVILRALGVVGVGGLVCEAVRKYWSRRVPKRNAIASVITYRRLPEDDDEDETSDNGHRIARTRNHANRAAPGQ